jgi:hypothetical protein
MKKYDANRVSFWLFLTVSATLSKTCGLSWLHLILDDVKRC